MIHNPYKKKRPRPSGWTSSSTSAPAGQQPLAPFGSRDARHEAFVSEQRKHSVRREEPREYRENDPRQIGDSNNQDRFPNDFEPCQQADKNMTNESNKQTNSKGITSLKDMITSRPSQKMRQMFHTEDSPRNFSEKDTSVSAKRTLASTINVPPRKAVYNPYAQQSNTGARVGVSTTKPSISNANANDPQYRNQPKTHARQSQSVGMNGSSVHEQPVNNAPMLSRGKPPHIENNRPRPRASCLDGTTTSTSRTVVSKPPATKLPPNMGSIRPASWKSTGDAIDRVSKPATDPSVGISVAVQQNSRTQSFNKTQTVKNSTEFEFGKTKDRDRLPPELSYTPNEVKPVQDEFRMPLIKNANLSSPLKNGWTLFPHQKKAIIRALTMRRMILALDMGLGKTLIGSVWSRAFKVTFGESKLKVFVICPVSLKEEWQRTAEEAVGLEVEADGKGKSKKAKGKKKSTNKEKNSRGQTRPETIAETSGTDMKMSICSWAKVPKMVERGVEHFVVCCDEAHAMQSTQAQRTKDVLSLVNDKRCVGVLLLTGTPMKNGKPGNLFPLLKAVRHPLGRHQKAYEAHFCNGMLKNFGRGPQWDASGASNLDQLKRKVASNLLHMTKEQCLKELPPMTTVFHDVPVSSRFQVQYEQAIKYLASVQANASNMREEAVLGAVQRLRVVCAHAKVEATVELARSVLNKEAAVVIFTYFAQVAKNVHAQLKTSGWPCSLLTGDTPQNKRQELVDKFQKGLSSVFVCTFGAGGVGLTLTAASTIILLDRPWTPGETRQAEDRIRRIGQVKKCTSYWMRSFDLDKQIDAVVESKKQTTNAVLDKNTSHKATSGTSKISINQLVHKFVLSEARKKL